MNERIHLFLNGARRIRNDRQIGCIRVLVTAAAMAHAGQAGDHGGHHGDEFVMALADFLRRPLDREFVHALGDR